MTPDITVSHNGTSFAEKMAGAIAKRIGTACVIGLVVWVVAGPDELPRAIMWIALAAAALLGGDSDRARTEVNLDHALAAAADAAMRAAAAEATARNRSEVIAQKEVAIGILERVNQRVSEELAALRKPTRLPAGLAAEVSRSMRDEPVELEEVLSILAGAADEAELCAGMEARHGSHEYEIRSSMVEASAAALSFVAQMDRAAALSTTQTTTESTS